MSERLTEEERRALESFVLPHLERTYAEIPPAKDGASGIRRLLAESAQLREEVARLRVLLEAWRCCPEHSDYHAEIRAETERLIGPPKGLGWGKADMDSWRDSLRTTDASPWTPSVMSR